MNPIVTRLDLQQVLASAGDRFVCVKFTNKPSEKKNSVLQSLISKYTRQFLVCVADVKTDNSVELFDHFNIDSTPTFVFMWRNKVVHVLKGDDEKLLKYAFEVLSGINQ